MDSFLSVEPPAAKREPFASISPPGAFSPPAAGDAPTTPTFDPQDEYRRLLDLVSPGPPPARRGAKGGGGGGGGGGAEQDVYQQLMARERRVLDTVDRVVNDDLERQTTSSTLLRMPVHELCMRTVSAVRGLFDDLVEAAAAKSTADALAAIRNPNRLPFLGIASIALALLLAAMTAL
jgi:hypothetical protein